MNNRVSRIMFLLIICAALAILAAQCGGGSGDDSVTPQAYAQQLLDEGKTPIEAAPLIRDKFNLSEKEVVETLCGLGCSLQDLFDAAQEGMAVIDAREIEAMFESMGYTEDQFLEITTFPTAQRFAPVLGFDRAARGYPISADRYYNNMLEPIPDLGLETVLWVPREDSWNGPPLDPDLGIINLCGRDECNRGMSNSDFGAVLNGETPTYWKMIRERTTGRLRIAYWWFYGFQTACNYLKEGPDGAHHGDWENVVVTTNAARDTIEAVTFAQHSGHYTRQPGGFYTDGERPMVFVGKIAHGSYHDRCNAPECSDALPGLECRYFYDFRNPTETDWWNTSGSLVNLMNQAESWMEADAIGDFYDLSGTDFTITSWLWGPHISYCNVWIPIIGCVDWEHTTACGNHPTGSPLTWDMEHCGDDGCSRSQGWPLPSP